MTALQAPRTRASLGAIRSGRLLFFELSGGCIHSMTSLGLICWSQLKLAYDGLEREFKYFRKLGDCMCTMCASGEQEKSIERRYPGMGRRRGLSSAATDRIGRSSRAARPLTGPIP